LKRTEEVDKLSNGKLAYVWLPNTGKAATQISTVTILPKRTKKGAIIDERFNHGGQIADYITDVLSRDLLGYFNNPTGDQQAFTAPQDLGTKVMIINEMAGSVETCFRICLRCERLAHWLVQQWGGLVGIWDVPSLIDGGTITAPQFL
jgi:tricorn protease